MISSSLTTHAERISGLLHLLLFGEVKTSTSQKGLGEICLIVVEAERVSDELLAEREKTWRQFRASRAVVDAILICRILRQPLPNWVADAAVEIIEKGKLPSRNCRCRQWLIHFVRWAAVKELRDRRRELLTKGDDRGSSWERCYFAVADAHANTKSAGSDGTIKASYQIVQLEIKAGRGTKFLDWSASLWAVGFSLLDHPGIILDGPA
jgi:hypothetical protein